MYGYDPIFLEKRKLKEWLQESEDNILVIFDKNSLKFSASPNDSMKNKSQEKVFCLKKQFLFKPEIKDIYVKCVLENGQIMVKKCFWVNRENRETTRCESASNFKEQRSKQPLKAVIKKN